MRLALLALLLLQEPAIDRLGDPDPAVRSVRYDDVPLENIASIALAFKKPVQEAFETASSPIK